MEDIGLWANDTFARLRAKQHVAGEQIQSLAEAGVSERRIDNLYPFDAADYFPGMVRALQDQAKHQLIFDALYSISIPYNLSTHLPSKHANALFDYTLAKGLRASRSIPLDRIRSVGGEDLAQIASEHEDLISTIETMIQLPNWLNVMRQYPFEDHHWGKNDQATFRGELAGSAQADIESYISAL